MDIPISILVISSNVQRETYDTVGFDNESGRLSARWGRRVMPREVLGRTRVGDRWYRQ